MIRTIEHSTVRIVEDGSSLRVETWSNNGWHNAAAFDEDVTWLISAFTTFIAECEVRRTADRREITKKWRKSK